MIENIVHFTRRYGDDYFADIAFDVLSQLDNAGVSYSVGYSGTFGSRHIRSLIYFNPSTPNKILFHIDHFDNYDAFLKCVKENPNTKFLIFSAQLDSCHVEADNLQIIHWGSDILLEQYQYQKLNCVDQKNYNSDRHWISISGQSRTHRVIAAILLKGMGVDKFGHLRINPHPVHDFKSWKEYIQWDIPLNLKFNDILAEGFWELKNNTPGYSEFPYSECFTNGYYNHASNFDNSLRVLYKESFVEIVNETVFDAPGFHVTEKFLNSIYGFNLPIVLGSQGLISHLRGIGFDMFDDVIDTSYDQIGNPMLRLYTAFKTNQRLLTDKDYAISCWKQCENRLVDNYQFAKNKMYSVIKDRVNSKISDAIYWLNE